MALLHLRSCWKSFVGLLSKSNTKNLYVEQNLGDYIVNINRVTLTLSHLMACGGYLVHVFVTHDNVLTACCHY